MKRHFSMSISQGCCGRGDVQQKEEKNSTRSFSSSLHRPELDFTESLCLFQLAQVEAITLTLNGSN